MFDFFKDLINEAQGFDTKVIAEQERKKREEEKKSRYIFSRKSKILIVVLMLLYLAVAIISCSTANVNIISKLKYVLLSIIDLVIIFSLLIGKRKGELIATISLFIFLLVMMLSFMI